MKFTCSYRRPQDGFKSLGNALLAFIFVVFIAPSVALSTGGLSHPNIARGFNQYGAATYESIDSVNLFNGGLGLSIPFGQRFTVSEQLSYQVSLQYGSSVWNVVNDEVACAVHPDSDYLGEPSPLDNAGLGWMASFGMMIERNSPLNPTDQYIYLDPSGGSHYFFTTLHEGEEHQGYLYTRDSTYLRGYNELVGDVWYAWIEFPNGVKIRFSRTEYDPIGEWRVDRMEDRFDGWVQIHRSLLSDFNGPSCQENCPVEQVRISDSAGRNHKLLYWTPDPVGGPDPDSETRSGLERADGRLWYLRFVRLHSSSENACYRLDYDREIDVITPEFDCRHINGTAVERVDLLSQIIIPDGSNNPCSTSDVCTDCSTYDFTYAGANPPEGDDGRLSQVILPTGGRHQYAYREYEFPDGNSGFLPWEEAQIVLQRSLGIGSRILVDLDDTTAVWTYEPEDIPVGSFDQKSVERNVTDPEGNDTIHHFNTDALPRMPNGDPMPGWDYGLSGAGGFFASVNALSREEFSGSASTGELLRQHLVFYERDLLPDFTGNPGTYSDVSRYWINSNRRPKRYFSLFTDDEATWYGGYVYRDTSYHNFDGLGHFREVTVDSNFGDETTGVWPNMNNRTTFTGYYPGSPGDEYPNYSVDQLWNIQIGSYTVWPPDHEWIVNTFDRKDFALGSEEQRSLFDFDPGTGFLKATRTLVNDGEIVSGQSNLSEGDILTKQTRIAVADGYRINQRFFGADSQQLSTSDPFPALPGTPVFLRKSTVLHGNLAESGFYNPAAPWRQVGGLHVNRDIDSDTGWVMTDRDVSGYPTEPDYDLLGRVTEVTSGVDDSMITAEYTPAYSGNGYDGHAAVRTRSYGPDIWGGMTIKLTDSIVVFDGFGRPWRRCSETAADGTWNLQVTDYDGLGRVKRASVINELSGSCSGGAPPSQATRYFYDRFGRPTLIKAPDGTETGFEYKGVREVVRTDHICTSESGGCTRLVFDSVETTKRYDSFGRLRKVVEPGAEAGAGTLISSFEHDVGGRMSQAELGDGTTTQYRERTFDNSGMLIEERIPERLNLPMTFEHDPLGNIILAFSGDGTLAFDYDAASRPTNTIWNSYIEMGEDWTLQQWSYYPPNAGSWNSNKLLSSLQRTPDRGGNAMIGVSNFFEYGGRFGNVDSQSTSIGTDPIVGDGPSYLGPVFDISYTWDPLGNMASVTYPDVAGAAPPAPDRTIKYQYENGWLDRALDVTLNPPGYSEIARISYHQHAMINKIIHGNGIDDVFIQDSWFMNRPQRLRTDNAITSTGADADWNSGRLWYDGVGNIYMMGADNYFYDQVGRLVQANPTMPDGLQHQYDHDFDAFGNLEAWTETLNGQPSTTNIPIQTVSNRVSSASYDWSGNILEPSPGVSNSNDWDPFSRLTGFTTPKGEHEGFGYDTRGDRILTRGAKISTITLRDIGGRPIREYRWNPGEGSAWSRDTIFLGRNAVASEASSLWPSGGQVLHHHRDHLGSLRLLTDPNKVVVGKQAFSPFGTEVSAIPSDNPLKFTGHEREPDFGWDYMYARYYTPEWGRFWSVDPVGGTPGVPQSWNSYSYVLGNPVNLIDPWGREDDGVANPDDPFEGEVTVTGTLYEVWTIFIDYLLPPRIPRGHGGGTPISVTPVTVTVEDVVRDAADWAADTESLPCFLFKNASGSFGVDGGVGPGIGPGGSFGLNFSRENITMDWGVGVGNGVGFNFTPAATVASAGRPSGWNNTLSGSAGTGSWLGGTGSLIVSEGGPGASLAYTPTAYGAGWSYTWGYAGYELVNFQDPPCSD